MLLCVLFAEKRAYAHRIDEYLQATLLTVERGSVQASMRLIPGVLVASSVIEDVDTNGDGAFSQVEQRAYVERVLADISVTLDGKTARPSLGGFSFPQPSQLRDGLGEIHIEYVIALPPTASDRRLALVNAHRREDSVYLVNVLAPQEGAVSILSQKRNQQQSTYELDFRQAASALPQGSRSGIWIGASQCFSLFHLGVRHIAEGTDHLLFLLVLLLPAPLCTAGARWGAATGVRKSLLHIVGIVTAFTLGHSCTLMLAAMDWVHVPGRPVEVFIAVSILISAVHAMRPLFPGREAAIASSFGLVHGLAFASTLDRLGLARSDRIAGILAFNLGIESMQMIVVALTLPSLLLMSRTRLYPFFRVGGATLAGVAALAWIAERLLDVRTPVDSIVNEVARHGLRAAGVLFGASLAFHYLAGAELRIGEAPGGAEGGKVERWLL